MCQSVTVKSLSCVDIWKVCVRAEPDQAGYDRPPVKVLIAIFSIAADQGKYKSTDASS